MNNNQGFTGFLIRKTVQPYSSRKESSNFNDFRNTNMVIYLNKKIGDYRERTGQVVLPRSVYTTTVLNIKPKARQDDIFKEKQFTNIKMDKGAEIIIKKMQKPEFQDDFFIETKGSSQRPKTAKRILDAETKLRVLMNENIEEKDLEKMFDQYRRQNLAASLNQLRSQTKDQKLYQKFQENRAGNGLQAVEFEDKEQVNYFMGKICEQDNGQIITAGKVLGVCEDNITYKKDIRDEFEEMRKIVEKRITNEQLNQILKKEEEDQQKRLVQIFKETRPDQIDPDFFKSKIKMTTMKKWNEVQDKQFQNFFSTGSQQENTHTNSVQKFKRIQKGYNKRFFQTRCKIQSQQFKSSENIFDENKSTAIPTGTVSPLQLNLQRLSDSSNMKVRPQTSKRPYSMSTRSNIVNLAYSTDRYAQNPKIDPETQEDIIEYKLLRVKSQELIQDCNKTELDLQRDKNKIFKQIDQLENQITKSLSIADLMNKISNENTQGTAHKEYKKFLNERKFKKKFVGYLIEHVEKKSQLLSQKVIEQKSHKQVKELLGTQKLQ